MSDCVDIDDFAAVWHAHACRGHVRIVDEEHDHVSVDHRTRRWAEIPIPLGRDSYLGPDQAGFPSCPDRGKGFPPA